MRRKSIICCCIVLAVFGCETLKQDARTASGKDRRSDLDSARLTRSDLPAIDSTGNLRVHALFYGPMPTGVAVSQRGRIFVNFPRWGDSVEFTVGELKDGKVQPYPNLDINRLNSSDAANCLVSVQSVVVDPKDRLWIVDTGSINMGPVSAGGAKLLCYDLNTDRLIKRITFPDTVVLPTTYLNDIRFNMSMGKDGVAFITDSSDRGPNGIIVVDIDSETSWRKLHDHPSTKADQSFVPAVEGTALMSRPASGPEATLRIGADGIAIAPDGKTLYYCPLASRRLYSVSTDALADSKLSDEETAKTVMQLPERDFASDGLLCDMQGNLLLTDYEHNAIRRFDPGGKGGSYEVVAQDPRLIWPDSMALSSDGSLFVTANQLNRQKQFHSGQDQRQQPYVLFRIELGKPRVAATPLQRTGA